MADNYKYTFAVSRVRVAENRLIDKNKIDNMVDSQSAEDVISLLKESGYSAGDNLYSDSDARSYERMIQNEERGLFNYIEEITPDRELINIFRVKNDYYNLKVLIKQELLGINKENLLSEQTNIKPQELKLALADRKLEGLGLSMQKAIDLCYEEFSSSRNARVVDLILDKAYYEDIFELIKKVELAKARKLLNEYFSTKVDLSNLKMFFRVQRMKAGRDLFKKAFLPNGSLNIEIFLNNFDEAKVKFQDAFKNTRYEKIVFEGISEFDKSGNLIFFEKLCDNYLLNYLNDYKRDPFGIGAILAYFISKETEIKNVRIIMLGKINGLSEDSIRESLRVTYV